MATITPGLDAIRDNKPPPASLAEQKFNRLRDEWKSKRGHEPSTLKIILIPTYQKIIGMGQDAIPFLLKELETDLDNWYWALMMITDEDPVPKELRGDGQAMARAWIQSARFCSSVESKIKRKTTIRKMIRIRIRIRTKIRGSSGLRI